MTTGEYKCSFCGELSKVDVESSDGETAVECSTCGAIIARLHEDSVDGEMEE